MTRQEQIERIKAAAFGIRHDGAALERFAEAETMDLVAIYAKQIMEQAHEIDRTLREIGAVSP
jgi:hypothetical protein